jgi:hypothetical protein
MSEAIAVIIGASVGAFIGPFAAWIVELVNNRRKRLEAVAALRFELASNLLWLDSVLQSLNYLRDEAWVAMKNNGYISYLKAPLPMMVARAYDRMHALNGLVREIRRCDSSSEEQDLRDRAQSAVTEFRSSCEELIHLFDTNYSSIAKNFRELSNKGIQATAL